jgi:hypothetical protein
MVVVVVVGINYTGSSLVIVVWRSYFGEAIMAAPW